MDNWIHGLCWLIVSAVLLAGCSDSSDGRRETAPTVSVAFNEIPGLVFSQQATLTTTFQAGVTPTRGDVLLLFKYIGLTKSVEFLVRV